MSKPEIEALVHHLPDLWQSHQKNPNPDYQAVIRQIGRHLGFQTFAGSIEHYNLTINWLDANYPLWRGYAISINQNVQVR